MTSIAILVVMVGMIWFMQRQQRKQAQERQEQLSAIQKGDEIVTIGGMFALVDEVDTDKGTMVLDVDGVYLTFEIAALKRIVSKAQENTDGGFDDSAVQAEDMDSAIESED